MCQRVRRSDDRPVLQSEQQHSRFIGRGTANPVSRFYVVLKVPYNAKFTLYQYFLTIGVPRLRANSQERGKVCPLPLLLGPLIRKCVRKHTALFDVTKGADSSHSHVFALLSMSRSRPPCFCRLPTMWRVEQSISF